MVPFYRPLNQTSLPEQGGSVRLGATGSPPTGLEAQLVMLLALVVVEGADPHFGPRGGVLVKRVGVPVGIRGGERVVRLVVRPVSGAALHLVVAAHAAREGNRGPERGAGRAGLGTPAGAQRRQVPAEAGPAAQRTCLPVRGLDGG